MNIRKVAILLDTLYTDIMYSDETQENKEASLETIDRIKEELNIY